MKQRLVGEDGLVREVAKIVSTHLGWEDHGIFTFLLSVDYGGSGQGLGHLCLSHETRDNGTCFNPGTMKIVAGVMRACGVRSWEGVSGKTVYVLSEAGDGAPIGIESLPTEGGRKFVWRGVLQPCAHSRRES